MTRLHKQHLKNFVVCLLVFSMSIVLLYCRLNGHTSTWTNCIFPVYVLVFVIIGFYNFRKRQIILTDEERASVAPTRSDYSNRFGWMSLFIVLAFFATVDLLSGSPLIIDLVSGKLPGLIIFPILLIPAILLFPAFYHIRNQYIIEGDTLHVKEYSFFKLVTEIRIPLSSIHAIYVNNTFGFAVSPNIFLNVDGIERKLYATSYALELAVAILQTKLR